MYLKPDAKRIQQPTWSDVNSKYSTFWVCPSLQVYLVCLASIVVELTRYRLRGIRVDYVRYPEAVEGEGNTATATDA